MSCQSCGCLDPGISNSWSLRTSAAMSGTSSVFGISIDHHTQTYTQAPRHHKKDVCPWIVYSHHDANERYLHKYQNFSILKSNWTALRDEPIIMYFIVIDNKDLTAYQWKGERGEPRPKIKERSVWKNADTEHGIFRLSLDAARDCQANTKDYPAILLIMMNNYHGMLKRKVINQHL